MLRAGLLTERLTIQAATLATDVIGGKTTTWATLAKVWAALEPSRASELFSAQRIGSQSEYRFRVRVRSDVTERQRVSWTPRWQGTAITLEIHGILRHPDRQSMTLECGVFS